ncbi:beach-domain-containing protein [Cristinia sonorae]|uniref:Beach-domain-containing protein n=1 Tax=Cristinia sonorae TaxID=1940300 RepID=A0A8K0USX1_9AGAR|nr:beach-domain-containing protein [Cristinia sonorae]
MGVCFNTGSSFAGYWSSLRPNDEETTTTHHFTLMLRSFLSPLSSVFSPTPNSANSQVSPGQHGFRRPEDDGAAPEDFARDVLIEVMRKSVERLKMAEGLRARTEVLLEIHKIMLEDACTKEMFRVMDGFLVLMSVLSTIQPAHSWPVAVSGDQIVMDVLEATRLVFAILSESLYKDEENVRFFEQSVGYESLAQAISPLLSDPKTVNETLGFLVALSLHDFSLSNLFEITDSTNYESIDRRLQDLSPRFVTIRHPGAIRVLYTSIPSLAPHDDGRTASLRRYYVYRLLERLSAHNHRNYAILNSLHLVGPLFEAYHAGTSIPESEDGAGMPKPERQVILKLLRRLLELGSTSEEARLMFRTALKKDETLNGDVLEVLRAGMKTRWPEHFSLVGPSALVVPCEPSKGLPSSGFTFMLWVWLENLPEFRSHSIFTFRLAENLVFSLRLRADGSLECLSSANKESMLFDTKVPKQRWTHIVLVHHPHRSSSPTIRLFLDGVLSNSVHWQYPKSESSPKPGSFTIGDIDESANMKWCIASAYFLSMPLSDEIPRLIQHLGPRYVARFQATDIIKFMTYSASTSLSVLLASIAPSQKGSAVSDLMKFIQNGLSIPEANVIFALSPAGNVGRRSTGEHERVGVGKWEAVMEGDVYEVRSTPLDLSMWKLGGASVALGLVQYAKTAHEVSRTLSVLTGGLRNSWQNSEDMERLRGYEILAAILRNKSHLINMTGFEILFEFLGVNFRSPDQSTVVNTTAYRAIALDFQLWAHTQADIQRVHLEHFTTLLHTSKHKRFNLKQCLRKMSLVRKLLFALQTDWYPIESLPWLVEALRVTTEANFTAEDAIKPIVAYLAANLHEGAAELFPSFFVMLTRYGLVGSGAASPRSVISRIDQRHPQMKAEQVFKMLATMMQSPTAYQKFIAALPAGRIYLLLLGDRPTSTTATQVLRLIAISLKASSSFSRKFELASGWSILKTVLPYGWCEEAQEAAFDILFGLNESGERSIVSCAHVLPALFGILQNQLDVITGLNPHDHCYKDAEEATEYAERLLEQLITVHSSSATFRQIFKSQSTTQHFLDSYRGFTTTLSQVQEIPLGSVRLLEKLMHLGLSIALDTAVAAHQKQEILDVLQLAETILNPLDSQESTIDPSVFSPKRPSRRSRMSSTRLSVHLGERTAQRSIARIHDWRKTVIATEKKRLRKTVLDLREEHRQVASLTEWSTLLTAERGLWPDVAAAPTKWRLDETEGPYRVRKKLENDHENIVSFKVESRSHQSNIREPESEVQSMLHPEVPPWADYEISGDSEDRLDEEVQEDKHRRVRHELEPGDVIEAVYTVARITGVDSSPGLLIFGRTHLYMLDGLMENDDGEIIDVHEAPEKLFFVPGSIVELDGPQRAQRWKYDQILNYSDRTCLFRDVALELYFKDSRSLLLVFLQKAHRRATDDRLAAVLQRSSQLQAGGSSLLLKSPLVNQLSGRVSGRLSARVLMSFRMDELSTAQRKWQAREISNFAYISILNQLSGRTPSDATQYPVFPWVIGDYTSSTLDLNAEASFRDLTRPMGGLTQTRREAAEGRYLALQSVDEKPFHYGTHFSSSMIVCHFLIRLAPFTNMFKTLQGGDWDLPDRLFVDIQRAYHSAGIDLRGDVRELIPEFFSCPEFLENSQNLDFGVTQNTGERINNVKLPPWAKDDPLLFVTLNRQALESDYVSRNLPAWIDLIWGCKQRDVDSLNVYHPLSYEGTIDLDSITDEVERKATVGIIHNFGQTPRKLFTSAHPERMMHGTSSLPIGTIYGIVEDYHLLTQGSKPVRDLGSGVTVCELGIDMVGERILPTPRGTLIVPSRPHESVEWVNNSAGDLRVLVDKKIVEVIEAAFCTCAAFADVDTLVTGSEDYTVRLWQLTRTERSLKLIPTHLMRSHSAPVTCVAASRTWSMVVSGSKDGSAALWDLNRGTYVRSIWHGQGQNHTVHLVAINESTGYVATCSSDKLMLHTINARPIATLNLTDLAIWQTYPPITSIAFHEREYSRQGLLATGSPDGSITLRTWNTDNTPTGEKARWEFVTLRTVKVKIPEAERRLSRVTMPCVTALRFIGEALYHGEDTGRVYCWELPD